jgi:YhcH/YjgK/YiaL family protein
MIFDSIKNLHKFTGVIPGLNRAVDFLSANDVRNIKSGDIPIKEEEFFLMVIEYETTREGPLKGSFEAHKKYIDVQYIVKGCEVIRHLNVDGLKSSVKYDPQNDFELFDCERNYTTLVLREGQFVIFFPQDGHGAGYFLNEPEKIKKLVFKVRC